MGAQGVSLTPFDQVRHVWLEYGPTHRCLYCGAWRDETNENGLCPKALDLKVEVSPKGHDQEECDCCGEILRGDGEDCQSCSIGPLCPPCYDSHECDNPD